MLEYTPEQNKAINTIDDNLQIIACAGSGKTQVISQRVVQILKSKKDIAPKNILAFTYTEKAAAELKTRVWNLCKEQIGDIQGMAEMFIGTIHAWCLQALQDNVFEYQKYSVLDEIKLKLFVDKYYSRIGMADIGMKRYSDTSHFIAIMGVLREAEIADGEELSKEWIDALEAYENTLQNSSYFDFTMIMSKALEHLQSNADFRQKIKDEIKYLIVDEYQDVNPVQESIVSELANLGCNVCVVGDDDQTIYQWRGGDVRYIQTFKERYSDVQFIKLEDNFRSTEGIVDTALKCINNNADRLPKVMKASGHQKFEFNDIVYRQFDDVPDENQFIVETIQKIRNSEESISFKDKKDSKERGIDYSDIAILIRTWSKAEPIMDFLAESNIPFVVKGVNNLFQRPEVKAAKAIFEYLNNDIEEDTLYAYWEAVSESINEADIIGAIEYLDKKKPKPELYYSSFSIQGIFWDFIEKANITEERFISSTGETIVGNNINEIIYYNLGMFSQMIQDFETIHFTDKPVFRLSRFLNFLQYSADGYYPEGWLNNSYRTPNAVQIMTIHQSKGLEFPVVFIPGMNKNYFPLKKPGGKQIWHFLDKKLIKDQYRYETSIEDERRLFYVAITRSKKYLFITRAPENRLKKVESVFCKEISKSDYLISPRDFNYDSANKSIPKPKTDSGTILLNFSVLKAFFDCPYRFKLISLYGFNQPITAKIGYGQSLHNVLMEMHRLHLSGIPINEAMIPEIVDRHLHLPYAEDDILEDTKQTSIDVTKEYFSENKDDFDNILYAEKDIQLDLGDGIMVNGRMDLIKNKDISGKEVTTIVDFKSKDDAQKIDVTLEQLSLYALGYKELTGKVADFLEIFALDENNQRKHREPLANDRLEEIKMKIVDSANDIRDNKLDKTCNPKMCKTCYQSRLCSGIN